MYPLYDRSGVDDDDEMIPIAASASRKKAAPTPNCEVHVCGMCSGSEAVLAEIEELINEVDGRCAVRESGCLGYCNEGPNAVIVQRGSRRLDPANVHVRILSLEASAKVVAHATGRRPALEDAGTWERLAGLRAARARERAIATSRWNAALHGLAEQAALRPTLRPELRRLLTKAGFPQGIGAGATMPSAIANYSPWSLESVTPLTKHSAVFRFTSTDLKRGTPHPRGRGRLPEPITWHTTLLAEVGPNGEGPLPWVERDYTPVSSSKEWEQGLCELLIKVYGTGAATSWLHRAAPAGARVWLSKPERTLTVPALVPMGRAFRPASVLLLLAGTGVVALPQLLAHRDPNHQLAISTPRHAQLRVPIDLVLSCREDDVLLLPQIAQWCADGGEASGVRTCTLLLTPSAASANGAQEPPFPATQAGDAAEAANLLRGLANVQVLRARLSARVVAESLARMAQPCRVVVSGPAAFNAAARNALAELIDVEEQVTILPA